MALVKYRTPFNTLFNDLFQDSNEENYESNIQPKIRLTENETGFEITLAIPGFKKEDIELEVTDGKLSIKGKSEFKISDQTKYYRNEISYGDFERAFKLPENVDTDKIDAKHEDGLLKIIIPKKELVKEKKVIKIK